MRPDDLTPSAKLRHAAAILERYERGQAVSLYELELAARYARYGAREIEVAYLKARILTHDKET